MASKLSQANINSLDTENKLALIILLSKALTLNDTPNNKLANNNIIITSYSGIKQDRLPNLTKPYYSLTQKVSQIYKYSYYY